MDQFCILDNEDGGSCACSDKNAGFEARLEKIKEIVLEAFHASANEDTEEILTLEEASV